MAEPQAFIHGTRLLAKAQSDVSLAPVVRDYEQWKKESLSIKARGRDELIALTAALNEYKDAVEPILDRRNNAAQEVLISSIGEEFLEFLFSGVELLFPPAVVRKPAKAYLDLVFHPKSFEGLIELPEFTVREKDHDFVIGSSVTITITGSGGTGKKETVIPAVAIECKRYIERNMLDECSGTAERIKKTTPYCLYLVVAEYLKMDDCSPELSEIDEVYILRKQKNSDRSAKDFKPNPIDAELVIDMFNRVQKHLVKVWWDPESAITTGKLFNLDL